MAKANYSYIEENRLTDVIRLIAVLAKDNNYAFRTSDGISTALNGNPKSAQTWFDIATGHPEFFKFNKDKTTVVLLIRFLNQPVGNEDNGSYEALTIDQTQKLIDQAISLHDKQIARYQRNNFKVPIWTALITAITTLLAVLITSNFSNKPENRLEEKMNIVISKIDSMSRNSLNKTDTAIIKNNKK